jgi:hypothetical protein
MKGGAREWARKIEAAVLSLGVCLWWAACASEQPKGPIQPTPQQVRGNADRAFEKLKQEEQERTGNGGAMPR